MPWCKDCEAEYRDEFARCPICHGRLVAEKPAAPGQNAAEPVGLVFLVKVETTTQKDMLQGALLEAGIPSVCREWGTGQVVRIVTGAVANAGAELYVHAKDLPRAIHLVQSIGALDLPPFDDADLEAAYNEYMQTTPNPPIPPEALEDASEPTIWSQPPGMVFESLIKYIWFIPVALVVLLALISGWLWL